MQQVTSRIRISEMRSNMRDRDNKPGTGDGDPTPVGRSITPSDAELPRGQHVAHGSGLPVQAHALHPPQTTPAVSNRSDDG